MRQGCGATSLLGRVERVRAANSDDSGATSRLGRDAGAQDRGSGVSARRSDPSTCANVGARPCLKKRFSPKAGPCAEKGPILSSRGRTSPKAGRCVTPLAQLLGLGEFGRFEQRMRSILAQRPSFEEMRARKIAAWEDRREGPSRLPAETQETSSARKGPSLPRRDLAAKRGRFWTPEIEILPSQVNAARKRLNVPAWEKHRCATPRFGSDIGAQAPNLGGPDGSTAPGRTWRVLGGWQVQTRKPRRARLLAGVWL